VPIELNFKGFSKLGPILKDPSLSKMKPTSDHETTCAFWAVCLNGIWPLSLVSFSLPFLGAFSL
jgi:hypothetical protein